MNIFYLARSPEIAAAYHCDKHVVKMILEYAQLLCTAHRVLDGNEETVVHPETGRKKKVWRHPDPDMDEALYGATHRNHPCAVWVREAPAHYHWVYECMMYCGLEFIRRYSKDIDHKTIRDLGHILAKPPKAIANIDPELYVSPPQCVAEDCLRTDGDIVKAYMDYYERHKLDFAKWPKNEIPSWFHMEDLDRVVKYGRP